MFFNNLTHLIKKRGVACIIALLISNVSATSVKEITIDDLASNAEFIFEGQCIETSTQPVSNSKFIQTVATYRILDIIKGSYSSDTIQLKFLGGIINGKKFSVGEMRLPKQGDHGIYFVETLSQQQVHPLLGWEQGYMTITTDVAGVERVGTSDNQPIQSIESLSQTSPNTTSTIRLSKGVVRGLNVAADDNWEAALSKQEFKNRITDILNQ